MQNWNSSDDDAMDGDGDDGDDGNGGLDEDTLAGLRSFLNVRAHHAAQAHVHLPFAKFALRLNALKDELTW